MPTKDEGTRGAGIESQDLSVLLAQTALVLEWTTLAKIGVTPEGGRKFHGIWSSTASTDPLIRATLTHITAPRPRSQDLPFTYQQKQLQLVGACQILRAHQHAVCCFDLVSTLVSTELLLRD